MVKRTDYRCGRSGASFPGRSNRHSARLESWYVAPDISGAEIAKYVLIGAEFHYFCYLAQKYSIGKNVYLTTATPRKMPRSSDNHDNAVMQCTLTSRYHNEARELMYTVGLSLIALISFFETFFPNSIHAEVSGVCVLRLLLHSCSEKANSYSCSYSWYAYKCQLLLLF